MKCTKCGKEISYVETSVDAWDGTHTLSLPINEEHDGVYVVDISYTEAEEADYDLLLDTLWCPECNEWPFETTEDDVETYRTTEMVIQDRNKDLCKDDSEKFHKIANFNNITIYMNAEDRWKQPFIMAEFEDEFCLVDIHKPKINNNYFIDLARELLIDWIEEKREILLDAWNNKDYSWIDTPAIEQN